MIDFKDFVELEEGLKPEHKMRPGWMIKADPVLKAKIAANKAKQKEMKALLGQKLKEDAEQIDELSSDTLQKYKTAAHKSIGNAAVKRHAGEMGSSEYHKNQDKRSKGINRADANKRLGTYKDKTPKKLDISASGNYIQKKYHSGSGGSRMSEELVVEGAYEKSEENKRSADAAKKQGDMFAHHLHMADHHDNLAQWHGEKGRHGEADKHAEKAEQHHEKAMALKEETELDEAEAPLKHHTATVSYHKKDDPHRRYEARFKTTHNLGKEETEKRAKAAFAAKGRTVYNIVHEEVEQIDELSNDTLSSYKKKAGESASAADKAGKFDLGHKRFKGIMKATFKQFMNDAKK